MRYTETVINRNKVCGEDEVLIREHPYPNSENIVDINYNQCDLYNTRPTATAVMLSQKYHSLVGGATPGSIVDSVWMGIY